ELYQFLGPGQAAGVGGEDAVGAEFHRISPGGQAKQRIGPSGWAGSFWRGGAGRGGGGARRARGGGGGRTWGEGGRGGGWRCCARPTARGRFPASSGWWAGSAARAARCGSAALLAGEATLQDPPAHGGVPSPHTPMAHLGAGRGSRRPGRRGGCGAGYDAP